MFSVLPRQHSGRIVIKCKRSFIFLESYNLKSLDTQIPVVSDESVETV